MVRRMYNKILIGALLLALIGPVMGGDSQASIAFNLSMQGNYSEAIELCDEVLDADPQNLSALITKAYCHSQLGDLDEAKKYIKMVEETNSSLPEAWYNIGRIYIYTGDKEDAVDALSKFLDLGGEKLLGSWGILSLGKDFYDLGAYDKAQYCIDRATTLEPKDDSLWATLSEIYFNRGGYVLGLEAADKALKINPKNVLGLICKGGCLMQMGSYRDAIDYFDRATDLDPNNAEAWYFLGRTYQLIGSHEYPNAMRCLNKATDIDPNYIEAWLRKYEIASDLGDGISARKYSDIVNSLDKNPSDFYIGSIYIGRW